jgi:hypothetical protein
MVEAVHHHGQDLVMELATDCHLPTFKAEIDKSTALFKLANILRVGEG